MSVTINVPGNRQTIWSAPSGTSAVTAYTRPAGADNVTLLGINIAASSAASATVWINDGSTDRLALDTKSISANTAELYEFGNPIVPVGGSIKVRTSSANNLTFTITIAEEYRL
jgi:hypothetical protein